MPVALVALPIPLPRMTLPVRVAQVGDGQLGVVLEGVEGLVTEQLLDVVHVGAGAEQFSGTRSAKRVRRDVGGEAGGTGVGGQSVPA